MMKVALQGCHTSPTHFVYASRYCTHIQKEHSWHNREMTQMLAVEQNIIILFIAATSSDHQH